MYKLRSDITSQNGNKQTKELEIISQVLTLGTSTHNAKIKYIKINA